MFCVNDNLGVAVDRDNLGGRGRITRVIDETTVRGDELMIMRRPISPT